MTIWDIGPIIASDPEGSQTAPRLRDVIRDYGVDSVCPSDSLLNPMPEHVDTSRIPGRGIPSESVNESSELFSPLAPIQQSPDRDTGDPRLAESATVTLTGWTEENPSNTRVPISGRNCKFPEPATQILEAWIQKNLGNMNPTPQEKMELVEKTGLYKTQVFPSTYINVHVSSLGRRLVRKTQAKGQRTRSRSDFRRKWKGSRSSGTKEGSVERVGR